MLTGLGLIGKLVELLASKLLSRQIDLVLDDRKRACRALVELYFCIDGLEDLTRRFVDELGEIRAPADGWRVANAVALHGSTLEALSRRFINIGPELERALSILDPPLADALGQLYAFKYSFLLFMSQSVELKEKNGERNRVLSYLKPSARILTIDMESYYNWAKDHPLRELEFDVKLEWPMNMLAQLEFEADFPEVDIELSDLGAVLEFRGILIQHCDVLGLAREKLRELISKNFKLEEVLYVSKDSRKGGL